MRETKQPQSISSKPKKKSLLRELMDSYNRAQHETTKSHQKSRITLEEAMKLNGIEDWTLTQSQQKFLIESATRLSQRYPAEWFQDPKNREVNQNQLKQVFKEL